MWESEAQTDDCTHSYPRQKSWRRRGFAPTIRGYRHCIHARAARGCRPRVRGGRRRGASVLVGHRENSGAAAIGH